MWQLLYTGLLGLLLISLLIFKLTQRIARASPPHRRPMEGDPDAHTGLEAEEEVEGPGEEDEPVQEIERGEEPLTGEGEIASALEEIEDGETGAADEGPEDQKAAYIEVEGARDGSGLEAKLEEAYMGYEGEGEAVGPGTTEAPSPEIVVPPPQPKEVERAELKPAEVNKAEEETEGMEVGEGTSAAGMTVFQTNIKALSGAVIAAIARGGRTIEAKPGEKILVGDRLLIKGPREARERAKVILQGEVRRIHLRQVIDQLAKKQKDLEEAKEMKRSVAVGKSELMESLDKRYKELMEAYARDAEAEISEGKEGAEERAKVVKGGEGPGKKSKKRAKDLSPKEYRDCFGNAEDYEKCKRDCGSEEECAKAVRLLEDV
ncbi:MAG: TrkA C-terminal domain-containing protein [Candidatus Hydrothermarchaeota archaeon]